MFVKSKAVPQTPAAACSFSLFACSALQVHEGLFVTVGFL